MKCLFVCKASTQIGLGHLIRSRTLLEGFLKLNLSVKIDFILIGDSNMSRLISSPDINFRSISNEQDFILDDFYDVAILDMIKIDHAFFHNLRNRAKITVSISPVFDMQSEVDILFTRTKYLSNDSLQQLPKSVFAGFEFALIQNTCERIDSDLYRRNLNLESFPIAISMGGGDAVNNTLLFLKYLKKCNVRATFWVMLGEGFKYSYDELVREIKEDSVHEIILANTNRNMWHILRNCVLLLVPGGITSYEAAYAGLPTICFLDDEKKYYLAQEIVEKELSIYGGIINYNNLEKLNDIIDKLNKNRNILMTMHLNGQNLVDKSAPEKIFKILHNRLFDGNK